ncbi:hypothetical protein CCACVL1_03071 [Corchorus capsularis]|uniref:Uncharacterized protein n=1 Tax=Corchorus capsularis TaxID=210143 RepID=A0A1R3K348_COCAP|nr:hypothetical protein CCACVL1_03071 [Corchorus capsularis]
MLVGKSIQFLFRQLGWRGIWGLVFIALISGNTEVPGGRKWIPFFDSPGNASSELFTYTSDLEESANSGRTTSTSSVNQPIPREQAGAGPSNAGPSAPYVPQPDQVEVEVQQPQNNQNPDVIAAAALRGEIHSLIQERIRIETDRAFKAPLSRLFPESIQQYHQSAHSVMKDLELNDEIDPAILREFIKRLQEDPNFLKTEIRELTGKPK